MDANILARIQFAVTVGFHFLFPPITIGLSWLIVFIMSRYLMTRDEVYKTMSHFWIRILAATFAIGLATGLTMEFQFGTNWSAYSRYVGDVFGAPLAIETIFAFFLESSFIALLVFGWGRLSFRMLWFAGLMVAVGASLSAFWILAANSWQQTPAGFQIANGRAELTSFAEAICSASTLPRVLHTLLAAMLSGAFVMAAISAIHLLRNPRSRPARISMQIGVGAAMLFGVLQFPAGHLHAVQVVKTQPEKLAAFEAHFETQKPAYQILLGIPDEEARTVRYPIRIPRLLSLLAYGNLSAEVKGLEEYPRGDWPPVAATFLSFRLMVLLGTLFALIPLWGLLLWARGTLFTNKTFLWVAMLCGPLPLIANELGWITAEVGRQPWTVWHLLRTKDAASVSVSAGTILFSLIVFSVLYLFLFFVWISVLRRLIRSGYETASKSGASTLGMEESR
jgi:cytochrome bd ubiquinol oxidase subunit I